MYFVDYARVREFGHSIVSIPQSQRFQLYAVKWQGSAEVPTEMVHAMYVDNFVEHPLLMPSVITHARGTLAGNGQVPGPSLRDHAFATIFSLFGADQLGDNDETRAATTAFNTELDAVQLADTTLRVNGRAVEARAGKLHGDFLAESRVDGVVFTVVGSAEFLLENFSTTEFVDQRHG